VEQVSAQKHSGSFAIISRGPNVWQAKCGRHAVWTGPTYEAVEDQWRRHVYAETGVVSQPCGDKTDRWMP